MKESELTERQKILRRDNQIHKGLTVLYFNASTMSELPEYSLKEVHGVIDCIADLHRELEENLRKRARYIKSRDIVVRSTPAGWDFKEY